MICWRVQCVHLLLKMFEKKCKKIVRRGHRLRCSRLALCLFLLFGLLLCFPFGKLPLPVLALEKLLNLREQDTGQGLYFMEGDSGAVVVGFLFSRHRAAPCSKPFLVEQVALKHCPVMKHVLTSFAEEISNHVQMRMRSYLPLHSPGSPERASGRVIQGDCA